MNVSGAAVTASATVRNSGERAGAAIPQFYLVGTERREYPAAPRRLGTNRSWRQAKSGR